MTGGDRRCRYCSSVFGSTTSTGTLSKHLEKSHGIFKNKKAKRELLYQSTIEGFQSHITPRELISNVTAYVVGCHLPHDHVASDGFRSLLAKLAPGCVVPCPKTVARRILQMYIVLKTHICRHLAGLDVRCSITFDGWSNASMRGFYATTLHWVNVDDCSLEEIILDFFHVPPGTGCGKRCGDHLASLVKSIGLTRPLMAFVSDNGSDAISAATTAIASLGGGAESETQHVRCFAHTFQLAIKSMTDAIAPSVQSLRSHVAAIRASKRSRAMFLTMSTTILGKQYQPPTIDTPTRWNSTHTMLRECIKCKQVLIALLSTESVAIEVDWQSVEDVQQFLEVPSKVSTQLGTSHSCSLTLALAANNVLIQHCNKHVDHPNGVIADASSTMLQCLIRHARDLTCSIASVAKFLDLRVARDTSSADFACDRTVVEKLLASYHPNESVTEGADATPDIGEGGIDLFGSVPSSSSRAQSELQMFTLHPQLSRDVNVLEWWKTHKSEYPKLYKLAMDHVSVPATSVPSERANSAAKRHFDGRARLGDVMFKAEICVESWLRFAQKAKIDLPKDYLSALEDLAATTDLSDLAKDDAVVQHYLDLNS